MSPRVVVIGSANLDMIVRTDHIPGPGETILGDDFITAPGGKGANQAVAASRLGADVHFVAKLGADTFGDTLWTAITSAGVRPDHINRDPGHPTGVALISIDSRGENAIVVAPGANRQLCIDDIRRARSEITDASAIVLQLEIPRETVTFAVSLAHSLGKQVILNPAPIDHRNPLPVDLLSQVDILTPNEIEAATMAGFRSTDGLIWTDVANRLLSKGVGAVVITLGDQGCLVATHDHSEYVPAISVSAIDSTAAGDCFTAALSVALSEGSDLLSAANFANRAAAISVTRIGAQPSLPYRSELGL